MVYQAEDIFAVVARSENTPELEGFWLSRYTNYLSPKYFIVHARTLEAFTSTALEKPFTPLGELKLDAILTQQKTIDAGLLQEVLYIAVRFLDGCIDILPFTPEARRTVERFRKVGIGLTAIETFLESKNVPDKQPLIDAIGEQFTKNVYRASEALAEEKGAFIEFPEEKKKLTQKVFVRWVNQDTGTLTDGFSLAVQKTQDQIALESWEQVPRRNSHLLALPNAQAWAQWSDREQKVKSEEVELPQKKEDSKNNEPQQTHRLTVGELVKVIDKTSQWYGRVGQIVELVNGPVAQVKLASTDHAIDMAVFAEEEVGLFETSEVIAKLDGFLSVRLVVIVLNANRTKVYTDKQGKLLSCQLIIQSGLATSITKYFQEEFQQFIDIMRVQMIAAKTRAEIRLCEIVLLVQANMPAEAVAVSVQSEMLSNEDRKTLQEALAVVEMSEKQTKKIEVLQSQIEEQKMLGSIQTREAQEVVWLKNFPSMQGSQKVVLESGYQLELVMKIELGKPSSLMLLPVGEVPTSVVTIMKLVELSVSPRIKDSTQFVQALNGLASIARSTGDGLTLEIVEKVAETVGISLKENKLL